MLNLLASSLLQWEPGMTRILCNVLSKWRLWSGIIHQSNTELTKGSNVLHCWMYATGAQSQLDLTLAVSYRQMQMARCVPLTLHSPIEPMGHGCFAICPCRVRDHIISRASTGSQLSAPAGGSWEEAGGRCVVISSGTSAMGEGMLVLLFLLPKAEVVVGRPVLLVAIRGVVLAVVLTGPSAPDVDTPETEPEQIKDREEKRETVCTQASTQGSPICLPSRVVCWL